MPPTAACHACCTARTPAAGATGMGDDAAAAQIHEIDCAPGPLIGFRRLPAPLAGARHRQGAVCREKIGVVTALNERTKLSSGSQYLTPMPLIWNWSTPSSRQKCC